MNIDNQQANLERFGEWVLADRELHDRLRSADVESFPALVVQLGSERGYVFTEAVVKDELQKKRHALREKWI
jgi:hypothetical protein